MGAGKMRGAIKCFAAGFLLLATLSSSPQAFAQETTIKISLLDMTSMGGHMMGGGYGYGRGMMGRGSRGPGMMGPDNYGMHGRGGYGPGFGMMGHGMMFIRSDHDTVKAGKIQFDVTNLSKSELHEMAVIAVDSPDATLPYDYNTWRVIEKDVKMIGETGEMKPDTTKKLELNLAAGSYLLICNLPGHYAAGMVVPLTVTK
jgi:uncharacterized cupredoxin-like copper-binding protein